MRALQFIIRFYYISISRVHEKLIRVQTTALIIISYEVAVCSKIVQQQFIRTNCMWLRVLHMQNNKSQNITEQES